jgi:hypothetical protein
MAKINGIAQFRSVLYVVTCVYDAVLSAAEAAVNRLQTIAESSPDGVEPAELTAVGTSIRKDLGLSTCLDLSWMVDEKKETKKNTKKPLN